MKTLSITLVCAATLAIAACGGSDTATTAPASTTGAVDPAIDQPTNSGPILAVAKNNPDFSSLVQAVQTAQLGDTLSTGGPYTVFGPTNAAFDKLSQTKRDRLMGPEGEADLTKIIKYHVVAGDLNAETLMRNIRDAGAGGYKLTTLAGGTITATMQNGNIVLRDAQGDVATVTQTDVTASNGVIHGIDTVLMP